MKTSILYRLFFIGLFMSSSVLSEAEEPGIIRINPAIMNMAEGRLDSVPARNQQRPDKRPDIKEVPRSRRLPKPEAVPVPSRMNRPPMKGQQRPAGMRGGGGFQ